MTLVTDEITDVFIVMYYILIVSTLFQRERERERDVFLVLSFKGIILTSWGARAALGVEKGSRGAQGAQFRTVSAGSHMCTASELGVKETSCYFYSHTLLQMNTYFIQ